MTEPDATRAQVLLEWRRAERGQPWFLPAVSHTNTVYALAALRVNAALAFLDIRCNTSGGTPLDELEENTRKLLRDVGGGRDGFELLT